MADRLPLDDAFQMFDWVTSRRAEMATIRTRLDEIDGEKKALYDEAGELYRRQVEILQAVQEVWP